MGTFAQWVHDQAERDDSIGYFAKYWAGASPGKISSVGGIGNYLGRLQDEYPPEPPEGQSQPAWQRGKAALDAAMAGYRLAVDEFHRETGDQPQQAPAPPPEEPPQEPSPGRALVAEVNEAKKRARKTSSPAAYTGWPEERFNRVEELLATIAAQNEAILALLGEVLVDVAVTRGTIAPQETDWDELAAMADYSAVPE